MAIVNAGNVFPIYDNLLDQVRFRTGDANFHFIGDDRTLIPWQLPLASIPTDVRIFVVGRDMGVQTSYEIDVSNVEIKCEGTRAIVTYYGAPQTPGYCGFYYLQIDVDGTVYYSEMLYLQQRNDYESVGFGAPSYDAGDDEIDLSASDTLSTDLITQNIELKNQPNSTGAWVSIGSATASVSSLASVSPLPDGYEERFIRRTVETEAGALLQTIFRLHWDPTDPGGTVTLIPYHSTSKHHRKDRFSMTVTNTLDIEDGDVTLYYSRGYTQRFDFNGHLHEPRGEITANTIIDGTGARTTNAQIAKQRLAVTIEKVPDQALYFFQFLEKCSSVTIRNTVFGDTYALREIELQIVSTGLFNTVEISWLDKLATVSGCLQNIGFDICA